MPNPAKGKSSFATDKGFAYVQSHFMSEFDQSTAYPDTPDAEDIKLVLGDVDADIYFTGSGKDFNKA